MDIKSDLSKSTYSVAKVCPWKAYAHKVLGLKSISNIWAANGSSTHKYWGDVLSGELDLQTALSRTPNNDVRDLLNQAILNEPIPWATDHVIEAHRSHGGVGGYLDRIGTDPLDGIHFVEDLKTGRYEADDPFERDCYVYLEHKATGANPIKFIRYFCRSGNAYTYHYGSEELAGAAQIVKNAVAEIQDMDPIPMPGDHCSNWYGSPCQFLGKECPLSEHMPALVETNAPLFGQAFLNVHRGEITSDSASLAYQACQQLQRAVDDVMDRIKTYSRETGPITVGNDQIGWKPISNYNVDRAFALEIMQDYDVSTDDMARAVSISQSSIKRLPRNLNHVRDVLLRLAVTHEDSGSERFMKL